MEAAELLLRRWDEAANKGRRLLRSDPSATKWRLLSGSLGIIVSFNPLHHQNKRPSSIGAIAPHADTRDVVESSAFNFTKAKSAEFLYLLDWIEGKREVVFRELEVHVNEDIPRHAVLVNISPLMRGHILCVFNLQDVLPQALTRDAIRLALSFGHHVGCRDFHLGFNSVGAWSSVNHCHFQGYWMREVKADSASRLIQNLPVVDQTQKEIFRVIVNGCCVTISSLPHWPMHCWAISASHEEGNFSKLQSAEALTEVTWEIVCLLQSRSVPHNVLMSFQPSAVTFVFPRQLQQENGRATFGKEGNMKFAVAEVSGLVVVGTDKAFTELDEGMFEDIMHREVSISDSCFWDLNALFKNISALKLEQRIALNKTCRSSSR